jgi:hypothetical protein
VATLSVQKASRVGAVPAYVAAAAGGDKFPAGSSRQLRVKNASVASIDVTINSQAPCNQGFDHDLVIAVGAGAEKVIGGLDAARFADVDGYVNVAYSAVTTVTVAVEET